MEIKFIETALWSDKRLIVTSTDEEERVFLAGLYDRRLPAALMEINADKSITLTFKH